jgi:hypothetical protein
MAALAECAGSRDNSKPVAANANPTARRMTASFGYSLYDNTGAGGGDVTDITN